MPKPSEIAEWKKRYSSYSDERLLAEKHQWVEHSEMHIAAIQLLHERQKAREEANHEQLLAEIKRPHWSVTPSFYLLVVSVLLSAVALVVTFVGLPQAQSPAAATAPSKQTTQPVRNTPSNSQPQLQR